MSSSSSSSSSFGESSSTSSGDFPIFGATYYSEFVDVNSINNPLVDNDVRMKYSGTFEKVLTPSNRTIDPLGFGIRRNAKTQGVIFSNDASKLFSIEEGYVAMTLTLPNVISNGIYELLTNRTTENNENIIWGVNVGRFNIVQPGMYAAFTPRGIEFTVWTASSCFTIRDTSSDINKNTRFSIEFLWNAIELDNYLVRTMIRVNNNVVATGNQPISTDPIFNLNFYALDTPFGKSNLDITISRLYVANNVPREVENDFFSSSSSSSSFSSSSSSLSS